MHYLPVKRPFTHCISKWKYWLIIGTGQYLTPYTMWVCHGNKAWLCKDRKQHLETLFSEWLHRIKITNCCMYANKLRLIVWMWSLFTVAFLASEGSEMSEPQSLMLLPHSFFSPVSWQASCTEEAETKLLPVMTKGNTKKKEVRPLPVKEHSPH